jgi:hypothetical protein
MHPQLCGDLFHSTGVASICIARFYISRKDISAELYPNKRP